MDGSPTPSNVEQDDENLDGKNKKVIFYYKKNTFS